MIATIIMLCMTPVEAHDWYPLNCCSNRDCSAIDEARVVALGNGGYLVDSKFLVLQNEIKISPDGRFHACFPSNRTLRCFFAPPRSF